MNERVIIWTGANGPVNIENMDRDGLLEVVKHLSQEIEMYEQRNRQDREMREMFRRVL